MTLPVEWLRAALTPGIGPAGFLKLIQAFGDIAAAVSASPHQLEPLIGPAAARALKEKVSEPDVEAALAWAGQPGCSLLTLLDADYPAQLAEAGAAPPLLFARGRRELLSRPMLAMVGSRNATPQGLGIARDFSAGLAESGYTIVSGLASGIDTAAHEGALGSAASTVAVIGTGIDRVYPSANRALAHRLAEEGLLLSEFPLGMQPLAENFPRRNRIIAGLARGCLVVEANVKSGSLITARLAAEAGREVLAIPGSIHNAQARGCHRLIKEGAKLVETVEDVLEEVGRLGPTRLRRRTPPSAAVPPTAVAMPELPDGLSDTAQRLLESMGYDPMLADTLADRLGLTAGDVYAMLLELELAGLIAGLPGQRFQRLR